MKKIYFLSLCLCYSVLSFSQVNITELADPTNDAEARYVEIYNLGNATVDLTSWSLKRYTNGSSTFSSNTVDLTPIGSLASGSFAVIAANGTNFQTVYGVAADIDAGSGGPADSNGDDQIALFNASDALVDIFGVPGEDGSGTCHEFEDGRAERKATVISANTTWTESEWNVWADSTISGCSTHTNFPRTAPTDYDPKAWVGRVTTPTLTINSPSAGAIENTTSVAITMTIANFSVSGDNGSGASDNSGDGYIQSTFETQGGTSETTNFFTSNLPSLTVVPGNTYTLTLELLDNAGASLNPVVIESVTFTIEYSCDLTTGDITTTCDAITSGSDTYSATIAFTGGNTGITYTITPPTGVTLGGDNPDTVASGTITLTGLTEGSDAEISIVGGANSSCDLTRTLVSPSCIPFPIVENFDYSEGSSLREQDFWKILNTGDEMLIASESLEYTGLSSSVGNKVTFSEAGSETYTEFTKVSSGAIYASFLLKITGFQTSGSPDLTNGGYIAALAGSTNSYDARFWVRPNPDTSGSTFDIGFGHETSNPTFTSETYNLNEVVFVVMSYNLDTSELNTWINPDTSSFEGSIPSASITSTDSDPPLGINLFMLRQDSNKETPFVEIDELRIATSWAEVTPKSSTAQIHTNQIEGFTTYPNPVINKKFTVKTLSSSNKQVAIFNVLGKKVFTQSFAGLQKTLNVSMLNAGIYIFKVTEQAKTVTKKLVIR
jgi:hypothetical protein